MKPVNDDQVKKIPFSFSLAPLSHPPLTYSNSWYKKLPWSIRTRIGPENRTKQGVPYTKKSTHKGLANYYTENFEFRVDTVSFKDLSQAVPTFTQTTWNKYDHWQPPSSSQQKGCKNTQTKNLRFKALSDTSERNPLQKILPSPRNNYHDHFINFTSETPN